MIRKGTTEDMYVLKKLWDSGFRDPMNYINFVFDRITAPTDVLVSEQNGKPVAMTVLLDLNFTYRDNRVKVCYIFGATTRKRYRGKGYMTHLLLAAEEEAKTRGAVMTILVPGEEYLFNYYRKRGYSVDFYHRHINVIPGAFGEVPDIDTKLRFDEIWSDKFYELREMSLADIPHVEWSEEQCRFVMDDCYIYGEHIASYKGKYGEAYAVYRQTRRSIYAREVMGSSVTAQLVLLKEIATQTAARSFTVLQPIESKLFELEGERVAFGMSKPFYTDSYIRDLDGYMNLMLN